MKNKKQIIAKRTISKNVSKIAIKKVSFKAAGLIADLETKAKRQNAVKDNRPILQKFFKTGKGEYGAGDVFLGLKVPLVRQVAKKYQSLSEAEIKKLLSHRAHEIRLAGILILVAKYETAKSREEKKKIVGFYLENSSRINNWDLVDLSVYKILGDFLLDEAPKKAKAVLSKLASSKNLWERRMAMVSTFAFIKAGRKEEVLHIAKQLLNDGEELIHKASGWMLRELGKRVGEEELHNFLELYGKKMPRVALRYATEKFDEAKKKYYYNLNKLIK